MDARTPTKLRVGAWCVHPASGQISRDGESIQLEARTMRLLVCLADHAGEVVSLDDLLNQVWSGVNVSPDSVYQAVASLRRQLGDDPKQPTYIATVPRLGYRMVAPVAPWSDNENPTPAAVLAPAARGRRFSFAWIVAAWLAIGVVLVLVMLRGKDAASSHSASVIAAQSQKSIAVLPFLDLTEGMKEEEFADGVTEELIDKLSKIPGVQVPSAASSFYFKNKKVPVAEIAKSLGVAYVLDGSVRKSGGRVRIAARLSRPENGYVIWSETYDRPFDDIVMIQDDIAGEVTKALRASIDPTPARDAPR